MNSPKNNKNIQHFIYICMKFNTPLHCIMKRTKISLINLLLAVLFLVGYTSCSDDDNDIVPGFTEWTYPTSDNPVRTIEWLAAEKENVKIFIESHKSAYITHGYNLVVSYIRPYQYHGATYYLILFNTFEGPENISYPSRIYTTSGEIYLDDVSDPKYGIQKNEAEKDFFENGTADYKMWQIIFSNNINEE